MDDDWKTVEVFLPCTLTARDVGHHARSTIRMIATEAGDFVGDIKIRARYSPGRRMVPMDRSIPSGTPRSLRSTRCSNEVPAAEATFGIATGVGALSVSRRARQRLDHTPSALRVNPHTSPLVAP